MTYNYRSETRTHLKDAKSALGKSGAAEARSAALSLRMCMESLTYERAKLYKDDLPQDKYETWQPIKLMTQMIEIDPSADAEMSLSIGKQPNLEEAPSEMHYVGTEKPLNLKTIKEHYNAIGSYLHVPTMKQLQEGKFRNEASLRKRCEVIIKEIEASLSSTMWNLDFKQSATMDCSCGEMLTRRFKDGQDARVVSCHDCGALYTLVCAGKGKVEWHPHQTKVRCVAESCDCEFYIPDHQAKVGAIIECMDCPTEMVVALGVTTRFT